MSPCAFAPSRCAATPRAASEFADVAIASLMGILDEIDYGMMLVASNRRLLYANRVALSRCTPAGTFQIDLSLLRLRRSRHDRDLQRALDAAATGRRSMLRIDSDEGTVMLAVVPMPSFTSTGDDPALLIFGKREPCQPLSLQFFCQSYRLTCAEGKVLKALCDGLRAAQIAVRGGIALSTVRTHIGKVRAKTEAGSIGELIGMVMAVPPMASLDMLARKLPVQPRPAAPPVQPSTRNNQRLMSAIS